MRLANVDTLEKELVRHKDRKRTIFPQIRCDARLFNLIKSKKRKSNLTWEEALIDMSLNWLKR